MKRVEDIRENVRQGEIGTTNHVGKMGEVGYKVCEERKRETYRGCSGKNNKRT